MLPLLLLWEVAVIHARPPPVSVKRGGSCPSGPCRAAAACLVSRGPSWQPHLVAQPRRVPTETRRKLARCAGLVSPVVSALPLRIPPAAQAQVNLPGFVCVGHSVRPAMWKAQRKWFHRVLQRAWQHRFDCMHQLSAVFLWCAASWLLFSYCSNLMWDLWVWKGKCFNKRY